MSRSIPWRSKPTSLILQMIQAAKDYKLYLVNQTGPFSFVFKDDSENKFKVTIGSTLKCSCGIIQNDHCIHTIFVLLKRFKVDEKNQIIWQPSYTDSELEGLLSFKYTKKVKTVSVVKKNNLRAFNQKEKEKVQGQESDFSEIDQNQNCPICYCQLQQQCFSTCKQCKNHIHTKCFKIWIKHKQQNGQNVTCPLCRNHFVNPIAMICKDLQKWNRKFTIHKGTKCEGCGVRNINGEIYHCLMCDQCNLCKNCFNSNQHTTHDRFLTKNMVKEGWRIAKPRNLRAQKKYLQVQKEKQTEEKQPSSFEMIRFMIDSIPTVKESKNLETKTGLGLGIVGNELMLKNVCKYCNEPGNDQIKKLQCNHFAHEYCLLKVLEEKRYYCECGQAILSGYLSALGIRKKKLDLEIERPKNNSSISNNHNNINISNSKIEQTKSKIIKQTIHNKHFEETMFKGVSVSGSAPFSSKPPLQKTKINHFRVRKSTLEKKPLNGGDIVLEINNMPIRSRSLLRSGR